MIRIGRNCSQVLLRSWGSSCRAGKITYNTELRRKSIIKILILVMLPAINSVYQIKLSWSIIKVKRWTFQAVYSFEVHLKALVAPLKQSECRGSLMHTVVCFFREDFWTWVDNCHFGTGHLMTTEYRYGMKNEKIMNARSLRQIMLLHDWTKIVRKMATAGSMWQTVRLNRLLEAETADLFHCHPCAKILIATRLILARAGVLHSSCCVGHHFLALWALSLGASSLVCLLYCQRLSRLIWVTRINSQW